MLQLIQTGEWLRQPSKRTASLLPPLNSEGLSLWLKPSSTRGRTFRWWAAIRKAPLGSVSELRLMYNQIEDE